jgi:hypothetical protein
MISWPDVAGASSMKRVIAAAVLVACLTSPSRSEAPEEWIARVHGAFGAFIPPGIKIGLDAVERLKAKPVN